MSQSLSIPDSCIATKKLAKSGEGVALRRIKLTTGHLDDFSRLSRHRVVSATFARNVSGDTLLGRSRSDSSVINIRM